MLTLMCPSCGVRADETELSCGGEAHLSRPEAGADDEAVATALFLRENPRGVHFERWRHVMGCGKWFNAARCTATLEVFGTYSAQAKEPPAELRRTLSERRPGWSWRGFSDDQDERDETR